MKNYFWAAWLQQSCHSLIGWPGQTAHKEPATPLASTQNQDYQSDTDGGRCERRMGKLVVGQNISFFVICDNAILCSAIKIHLD